MTEIELSYSHADAVEFVKAAMERAPGIASYELDAGGETVVGRSAGGLFGRGERIVVTVPDSGTDTTTIDVHAKQATGLTMASNPWKYKSAVVETVHDLRGRPIDEVVRSVSYEETDPATAEASATSQAWLMTAKLLLVPLALIALVVLLYALF